MVDLASAARLVYRPAIESQREEEVNKGMASPAAVASGMRVTNSMAPEDPGLLGTIADYGLSTISAVGNFLDVPGSMVRDVATWVPGGIEAQNPFDQLLSPLSSENRVTGEEMLQSAGLAGDDTWGGFLGGLALEIGLDPLTYATFGASAATKAGKAAQKAGLYKNAKRAANNRAGKELGKDAGRKLGATSARQTTTPRMLIDDAANLDDAALNAARENASRPIRVQMKSEEAALRKQAADNAWDANQLDLELEKLQDKWASQIEEAGASGVQAAAEKARAEAMRKFKLAGGTDEMLDEKLGGLVRFSIPFVSNSKLAKKYPILRERIYGALDMNPEDLANQSWFESFMGGIRGGKPAKAAGDINPPRGPDTPGGGGPDMPTGGPDAPTGGPAAPSGAPAGNAADVAGDMPSYTPPSKEEFSGISKQHARFQKMMDDMTSEGILDDADQEILRTIFSKSSLGPFERVFFRPVKEISLTDAQRQKIADSMGVEPDQVPPLAGSVTPVVDDADAAAFTREAGLPEVTVRGQIAKKGTKDGSGTSGLETIMHELGHAFLFSSDNLAQRVKVDIVQEFDNFLKDGTLTKYFTDNYGAERAAYFSSNPHEAFAQYFTDSVVKRKAMDQPEQLQTFMQKVRAAIKGMMDRILSSDGLSKEARAKLDAMSDLVGGFIEPEEFNTLYGKAGQGAEAAKAARRAAKASPEEAVEEIAKVFKNKETKKGKGKASTARAAAGATDEAAAVADNTDEMVFTAADTGEDITADIEAIAGPGLDLDMMEMARADVPPEQWPQLESLFRMTNPELEDEISAVFGDAAAELAPDLADNVASQATPMAGRAATAVGDATPMLGDGAVPVEDAVKAADNAAADVAPEADEMVFTAADSGEDITADIEAIAGDGLSVEVMESLRDYVSPEQWGQMENLFRTTNPELEDEIAAVFGSGDANLVGEAADLADGSADAVSVNVARVEPEDPAGLADEISATVFDDELEANAAAALGTERMRMLSPDNASVVGRALSPADVIETELSVQKGTKVNISNRNNVIKVMVPIGGKKKNGYNTTKTPLMYASKEEAESVVKRLEELLPEHMRGGRSIELRELKAGKNKGKHKITIKNVFFVDYVDARKLQAEIVAGQAKPTVKASGRSMTDIELFKDMRERAGKQLYRTEDEARIAVDELNATLPADVRRGVSYVAKDQKLALEEELANATDELQGLRVERRQLSNQLMGASSDADKIAMQRRIKFLGEMISRRTSRLDGIAKQIEEMGEGRFQIVPTEIPDYTPRRDEFADAADPEAARRGRMAEIERIADTESPFADLKDAGPSTFDRDAMDARLGQQAASDLYDWSTVANAEVTLKRDYPEPLVKYLLRLDGHKTNIGSITDAEAIDTVKKIALAVGKDRNTRPQSLQDFPGLAKMIEDGYDIEPVFVKKSTGAGEDKAEWLSLKDVKVKNTRKNAEMYRQQLATELVDESAETVQNLRTQTAVPGWARDDVRNFLLGRNHDAQTIELIQEMNPDLLNSASAKKLASNATAREKRYAAQEIARRSAKYTEEQLLGMKNPELKELGKSLGARSGINKKQMVSNILKAVSEGTPDLGMAGKNQDELREIAGGLGDAGPSTFGRVAIDARFDQQAYDDLAELAMSNDVQTRQVPETVQEVADESAARQTDNTDVQLTFSNRRTERGKSVIEAMADNGVRIKLEGSGGDWSVIRLGDWQTSGKTASRPKEEIASRISLRDAKIVAQKLASGEIDADYGLKFRKPGKPKPLTAAQLKDKFMTPRTFAGAATNLREDGFVVTPSFMFKPSTKTRDAFLKASQYLQGKRHNIDEVLERVSKDSVPAEVIAQRGVADSQSDATILVASKGDGGTVAIELDKRYHDTVMNENKGAKLFVSPGGEAVYKKGDEIVGVIASRDNRAKALRETFDSAVKKYEQGQPLYNVGEPTPERGRLDQAKDIAGNVLDSLREKIDGARNADVGLRDIPGKIRDGLNDDQFKAKAGVAADTLGGVIKHSLPFRLLRAHLDPKAMGQLDELGQSVGEQRQQALEEARMLSRKRMTPIAQQFLNKKEFDVERLAKELGDKEKAQAAVVQNYNDVIRYLEDGYPILNGGDPGPILPDNLMDLKPALDEMKVALDEIRQIELDSGIKSAELDDTFIQYLPRQLHRFPGDMSTKGNLGKLLEPGTQYQIQREEFLKDIPGGTATLNEMSIDNKISGIKHTKEGKQLTREEMDAARQYVINTYGGGQIGSRRNDSVWALPDEKFDAMIDFIAGLDPRHVEYQVPLFKLDPVQNVMNRIEAGTAAAAAGDLSSSLFAAGAMKKLDQPGTITLNKSLSNWSVNGMDKTVLQQRVIEKMGDTFTAEKEAMQAARDAAAQERAAKEFAAMGRETLEDGGWDINNKIPVSVEGVPGKVVAIKPDKVASVAIEGVKEPVDIPISELRGPLVTDNEVLQQFTVDERVANSIGSYMKGFTEPKYAGVVRDALESVTNLYKSNLTILWPAFHVRNFISGMYNNLILGATDPRYKGMKGLGRGLAKTVKDADALIRGQVIDDVLEIPMIKEMGITDKEEAMDVLRQDIFANKLVDYDQGWGTDVVGADMGNMRSQMAGLEQQTLRQAVSPPPRPTGASFLDSINPLRGSGMFGQDQDAFMPYRWGRKVGNYVEGLNRISPYIAYLRQGVDPAEAARRVFEAQFDYSKQTPFDRRMRAIFPFWSYTKNIIPFTIMNLAREPAGLVGKTIRATSSARTDKPVPTWIASQPAIPFGSRAGIEDGDASFITGLGLGFEDPLSMAGFLAGDPQDSARNVLSRMNPLIKAPLELAFGESTYFDGPGGGRDLKDMDPTYGRILSNISSLATGEEGPPRAEPIFGSSLAEHVLSNLPTARVGNTLRTMTDPRKIKNPLKMALNLGTGVKVTDVSEAAWDADVQNRVMEMMKDMGARDFVRTYFPQYIKDRMDSEELQQLESIEEVMAWLSDRAKQRAQEKELAATAE